MSAALGEIVIYTSKIDNGPGNEVLSPAMIIRNAATCVPEVIARWGAEPAEVGPSPVDGKMHKTGARPDGVVDQLEGDRVDLVVFGLGRTYREYNVGLGTGLGQWAPPWRFASSRLGPFSTT